MSYRAIQDHPDTSSAGRPRSWLNDVLIDHGPANILGPFFLAADAAVRAQGIHLTFAPPDALVKINDANRDSWRPLIPLFDVRFGGFGPDNGFCLVGYDGQGDIVATQAARRYDLGGSSALELIHSMRLLYPSPETQALPEERWEVTGDAAAAARAVTGTVAFSGASWYRRDYRGRFLSVVIPRISRCLAYTRWDTDWTISIMAEAVVRGGFAERCGYTNISWSIDSFNAVVGDLKIALVCMARDQLLDDLATYSAVLRAQVDLRIENGRAQNS